jgi:hypothetical protein
MHNKRKKDFKMKALITTVVMIIMLATVAQAGNTVEIYDYNTGQYLEGEINGDELEVYNYSTGEYSYEDIESIDRNGMETYDYQNGEYKEYEWD